MAMYWKKVAMILALCEVLGGCGQQLPIPDADPSAPVSGETTPGTEETTPGAEGETTPPVEVEPVSSSQYPAKAVRPSNSRMDKSKLDQMGFQRLPSWQDALGRYLKVLSEAE